jgi:diacylglycerol kinase
MAKVLLLILASMAVFLKVEPVYRLVLWVNLHCSMSLEVILDLLRYDMKGIFHSWALKDDRQPRILIIIMIISFN